MRGTSCWALVFGGLAALVPAQASADSPDKATSPNMQKPVVTHELHGGAFLWYYQPFVNGAKNTVELYSAILDYDARSGRYGFHFEPQFRDTKLRSFYTSNIWVQEVYVSYDLGPAMIKAGKIYAQFGKFWDNSFYGDIQYSDGLKLDTDHGLSVEGNAPLSESFNLGYFAQYFLIDGGTNGSEVGRDTISLPGSHRRNEFVVRAVPTYHFSDEHSIALGLSGEHFMAEIPQAGNFSVDRLAGDLTLTLFKSWSLYGEFSRQIGRSVIDFPLPGRASASNNYVLLGTEYDLGKWSARYNYSSADYGDSDVREYTYVPGIGYELHPNLSLLLEYAYWWRKSSGISTTLDSSLNVVLYGHF